MTDGITEKPVQMTAADYKAAAEEAKACAVQWLHNDDALTPRSIALVKAAELLRAADTLNGRANILMFVEDGADRATVEVFEPAEA